ncbi:MAG: histidinol-phosphate transaminase [Epsilonproteobacteria bacterium]|nr:histidinol-phosphate transaminase [Campylobacterota bacterium]
MFSKKLDNLKTYEAGKPIELVVREFGIEPKDIIKLASNENPYGCSKKVQEEVKKIIPQMSVYPDDSMYELKEGLAKKFEIESKNIIIGAGSDQVLEFAIHAIEPKKVLMSKTTFAMYEIYSKQVGAEIIKTPSHEHNLDEFRQYKDEVDIIFICVPNNPLGECLDWSDVKEFIDEVSKETLIIIDGAYQEYASFKDTNKKIPIKELLNYPNVLYTGTFSKAYGLGGMRIGYGIANEYIIQNLYKLRPPFNITTLSLKAGIEALKDEEFVNNSIKQNFIEMQRYVEFCQKKNLKYIPSYTNFITIFVNNSTEIADNLLKIGIIIRDLAGYGISAIRITIGQPSQNTKVLLALDKLI